MKKLDDILRLYIDKNHLLIGLRKAFIQDGFLFASNGCVLIRIAKKSMNLDNYNEQTDPELSNLFDNLPETTSVKLKDIEKEISQVELIDETITIGEDVKCEECDGDGIVEWEYERWTKDFDCPVCDGDGYLSKEIEKPTGKQIVNPEYGILIIDRYFKVKYVNVLLETMKFYNVDTVQVKYSVSEVLQICFEINENVSVLMMPYLK